MTASAMRLGPRLAVLGGGAWAWGAGGGIAASATGQKKGVGGMHGSGVECESRDRGRWARRSKPGPAQVSDGVALGLLVEAPHAEPVPAGAEREAGGALAGRHAGGDGHPADQEPRARVVREPEPCRPHPRDVEPAVEEHGRAPLRAREHSVRRRARRREPSARGLPAGAPRPSRRRRTWWRQGRPRGPPGPTRPATPDASRGRPPRSSRCGAVDARPEVCGLPERDRTVDERGGRGRLDPVEREPNRAVGLDRDDERVGERGAGSGREDRRGRPRERLAGVGLVEPLLQVGVAVVVRVGAVVGAVGGVEAVRALPGVRHPVRVGVGGGARRRGRPASRRRRPASR